MKRDAQLIFAEIYLIELYRDRRRRVSRMFVGANWEKAHGEGDRGGQNGENGAAEWNVSGTHATTPVQMNCLLLRFSEFTSGPRPRATKPPYISGWKPANEIRETLQLPSQTIFRGARTPRKRLFTAHYSQGTNREKGRRRITCKPLLNDTRRRRASERKRKKKSERERTQKKLRRIV